MSQGKKQGIGLVWLWLIFRVSVRLTPSKVEAIWRAFLSQYSAHGRGTIDPITLI